MKSVVIRIPLFRKTLSIQFRAWYRKISTHYGVTNETADGYYLPFWDFAEEFKQADILRALDRTQQDFGLSDVYVFQSSPTESYRAVCFDKLIWTKMIAVVASTLCLDDQFLRFSLMRGRFVLRMTNKEDRQEKLVSVRQSDFNHAVPSKDHQAFFSAKYPEIPKPVPYPQKINVRLSQYESFR